VDDVRQALTRLAIDRPHYHHAGLSLGGVIKERAESSAIDRALAAAFLINVLAGDHLALKLVAGAELAELVLWVLAFVCCRDASVVRDSGFSGFPHCLLNFRQSAGCKVSLIDLCQFGCEAGINGLFDRREVAARHEASDILVCKLWEIDGDFQSFTWFLNGVSKLWMLDPQFLGLFSRVLDWFKIDR